MDVKHLTLAFNSLCFNYNYIFIINYIFNSRNKLKDNVKGMFDIYMAERNKEVDYLKKKLDSMTVVFPVDSSDGSSDESRRTASPMDQDEVCGDR